jgi:hypothetical protein
LSKKFCKCHFLTAWYMVIWFSVFRKLAVPQEVKPIDQLRLEVALRMLKSPHFNARMNSLKEVCAKNKRFIRFNLLSQVLVPKYVFWILPCWSALVNPNFHFTKWCFWPKKIWYILLLLN